jgi:hypothetical protein
MRKGVGWGQAIRAEAAHHTLGNTLAPSGSLQIRGQHRLWQAEMPHIDLSDFPKPHLSPVDATLKEPILRSRLFQTTDQVREPSATSPPTTTPSA